MSKFNRPVKHVATSPIVTQATPSGRTHQGGLGYARDAKSELFLLAVTNMVGERTFYESAKDRDSRYITLITQNAIEDPAWTVAFLGWLRTEANMRSAAIVGAAEFVRARLQAQARTGDGLNRQVIASVLLRADEPGEMLAYWTGKYGRNLPKPVKRGVADALTRLYKEYTLLKYDTTSHAFRFADVIELAHPRAGAFWQGNLYEYALSSRHGNKEIFLDGLPMIAQNLATMNRENDPRLLLDAGHVKGAGLTWENVLSLGGQCNMNKTDLWNAIIPSMGYMALLRNLRNFDEAGISDANYVYVSGKLADAGEVARSRQLPMRFLSAYKAVPSLRWGPALETALQNSLANVPVLSGKTLILIDTSGSMTWGNISERGTLIRADAAAVFGLALALRAADPTVVSFSSTTMTFPLVKGEALLKGIERFMTGYFQGGGTYTYQAIGSSFAGHDRIVIVTDEQAADSDHGTVPATVPIYTWNLAGYKMGHLAGGPNRHTFGGLTDAGFSMIPLLEAGRDGHWPWEN